MIPSDEIRTSDYYQFAGRLFARTPSKKKVVEVLVISTHSDQSHRVSAARRRRGCLVVASAEVCRKRRYPAVPLCLSDRYSARAAAAARARGNG